ncbi:hypothetical protein A2716_03425 [candidate division WWE3 bacterium RIFCSPHIGHO2_01_FULL_40_23]|uniref:Phospho-N-acetylmuramoyl-pentapeptide-transferase n=1 Tax=candidate division WWE3 bacterium RIFCSPLOWO2_01_FULL_41_18 TaxID=1802625 RepID=A0A1F4VD82_UNCKA|nr:MAG: hypothetical protein A2716_03425 [candidate division WWE3 bacterium RIFCSPHIGHO2_01_FULL_40_23]OGC54930.1 MAG: hypothetical protein A3A78_03035 [candidate division WWE3 bacterium RIFCSPLOWO2_01_FULL_41_18]
MELKFLIILLTSFILCFLLAPLFIGFLYKFNIRRISKADLDNNLPERAMKFGTPIMGGALITFTVFVISVLFFRNWDLLIPFSFILVVGSIFGAVDEFINTIGRKGFSFAVREKVDAVVSKNVLLWKIYKLALIPWDLFKEVFRIMGSTQRGLKTHEKFLMQVVPALAGVLWLYFKSNLHVFWFPFIGDVNIGVLYIPFIIFLCLWFANAFGVTDGMDGLSAGLHSVSFLALGILSLIFGRYELALFCASVVGAELAFLYFNIYPARVEMSDVGTLPLGILFVLTASYLKREFALLFIGGIFIAEIGSSFIQQWSAKLRGGKRVFLLAPIHHHFEKLGWHETKVTMRFWLVNSILSVVGLIIALL